MDASLDAASPPRRRMTFVELPYDVRSIIYRQLLVLPTPLFVFQDSPKSPIGSFSPGRPERHWLALLYVNRKIHGEAVRVFYALNHFTLVETVKGLPREDHNLLHSLLAVIGDSNAGCLASIGLNFTYGIGLATNGSTASGGGALAEATKKNDIFSLLRDKCGNLRTLEFLAQGKDFKAIDKTNNAPTITDKLEELDTQLRAVPSLQKVMVRVYGEMPSSHIIEQMRGFGWTVDRGR